MSSEVSSAITTEVKLRQTDALDRPRQFKHWVRPKSFIYNYLYDYHRNYYDDIIEYLDWRRRGITRDIPRPQTWAERALRTYTQKSAENALRTKNDLELINKVHRSRLMHDFHTKDYNSRRFTWILF